MISHRFKNIEYQKKLKKVKRFYKKYVKNVFFKFLSEVSPIFHNFLSYRILIVVEFSK
jgi:hypothetical protein